MKFLVDANLPPRLCVWLRSHRHEAEHLFDHNLLTATDTQIWERCSVENLVILSKDVVQAGVFTAIMMNDAVHVAAAVLTRQDILLSWNFKHLVNRVRRAKINQVNVSQGLPTIEIVAPPEI